MARIESHVLRFVAAMAALLGGFAALVLTTFALTLGVGMIADPAGLPGASSLSVSALCTSLLMAAPSWAAAIWGFRAWRGRRAADGPDATP